MSAFLPPPSRLEMGNPNGMVTLWDMLRLYAHNFVAAFNTLGQAEFEIRAGHTIPSAHTVGLIGACFGELLKHCERLDLEYSKRYLSRATKDLKDFSSILSAIEITKERIWDELDSRVYVQIGPSLAKYYESSQPLFDKQVFDNFPSAIDDIAEAGNCLALERDTAVVFHLMRVMEAGLKVLAKELGIPYAPSWESYLRQINTLVEGDWKSKTTKERERQPLYKDLAGDMQSIKIAWRNPTMHIVKKYGTEEALQIYNAVKQFMTRLAEAGFSE